MRSAYLERRDALLRGLARHCGDLLKIHNSDAGLHVTACPGARRSDFVSRLAAVVWRQSLPRPASHRVCQRAGPLLDSLHHSAAAVRLNTRARQRCASGCGLAFVGSPA
jgi:hypothetical protein